MKAVLRTWRSPESVGAGYEKRSVESNDYLAPLIGGLSALSDWMQASNTSYVLVGGVAASFYGRPRLTQDLDALVRIDEGSLDSFVSSGNEWGYRPRISDCVAFARQSKVLLLHHQPTTVDADLICARLEYENDVIDRASTATIAGVTVQLPTPEDLIVMKGVALRPRDMGDIEGILDSREQLDWDYIMARVREFAEALDSSEIVRTIERLHRRHRGETEENGPF